MGARSKKNILIFLYAIIIISAIYLYFSYRYYNQVEGFESPNERNGIVFTCTTFFDYRTKDRWDRFCRAIDTIKEYHSPNTLSKIRKWVVVNEYSDKPSEDWGKKMKDRYPSIEFYQKNKDEKGQARSMNIILKKIRDAELWIHWEESWEVRKTLLDDAIDFMNTEKDITQLQFTFHDGKVSWLNVEDKRIHCSGRLCKIDPIDETYKKCNLGPYKFDNEFYDSWPLYSLLPSINRAKHYENLTDFSEDPKLWPIKFEWEFGCRWLKGAVKAVLKDGPVWRPGKHTSTYE